MAGRGSRQARNQRIEEAKTELPYGKWVTADGRAVLFNRHYEPIWQRVRGKVTPANRREWVAQIARAEWIYDAYRAPPWANGDAMARCAAILRLWGITPPCCAQLICAPARALRQRDTAKRAVADAPARNVGGARLAHGPH